jgi:SpoVK/Ycf46/Vps4 family AAA+-type ATPase
MHALYERKAPIPTLYVRSLSSFGGPEYSINSIFSLARRTAPCYLVFEDLDSIVQDNVRSYFLNEVDGIKRNDGILMLGSTNHLDRLDPGISKRPSRFDRKYLFPNPNEPQRVAYAQYWQKKLESNKDVDFPDALCGAIASITDGFSFAYIQEAMVASLLAIAARSGSDHKGEDGSSGDDDLDKLVLWREIKKQVKILRDEIGDEDDQAGDALPIRKLVL